MDTDAPWRALEAPAQEPPAQAEGGHGRLVAVAIIGSAVVLLAASVGLVTLVEFGRGGGVDVLPAATAPSFPPSSSAVIVVQVGGAVAHPGVYSLALGARVADAVRAAGGYSADVDPARAETALNLAARLSDGQSILVPRVGDDAAASGAAATEAGPLNLNTATAEQLDTLPGIGPATAAKIIAARGEKPFASVDDLITRKLISAATLAKFRDKVTV